MERTRRAAVVPCKLDWTDVGSWSELWRVGPLDDRRNRIEGEVIVLDTSASLIWSDGPAVGVVGLDDVIVVAAHGSVWRRPRRMLKALGGSPKPSLSEARYGEQTRAQRSRE